jgi:predicted aconitase with swiveling domain
MLREMAERGSAPLAIVFDRTNTILAQGALPTCRWSIASRPAVLRSSSAPLISFGSNLPPAG